MPLPRVLRRHRSACRRLVSGLLLVAILLGATGMPLPTWAAKDTSVPFPCMHRNCGCRNAAACWDSCCCHTNAQKLAWARRNGIQAPGFVIAQAAKESAATQLTKMAAGCCTPKASGCCTPVAKTAQLATCCDKPEPRQARSATKDWVRLEDARRCQGQAELWLMLSQVMVAQADIEIDCEPLPQEWLTLFSSTSELLLSQPAERPPRAVS